MKLAVFPEVERYINTLPPSSRLTPDTEIESGTFFNFSNGEVELPSYRPLPQDLPQPVTLRSRISTLLSSPKRVNK